MKKETGLQCRPIQAKQPDDRKRVWSKALLGLFSLGGMLWTLLRGIPAAYVPVLLCGFCTYLFYTLLCTLRKGEGLLFGAGILLAICLFFLRDSVADGMGSLLHIWMERMGLRWGKIYLDFETASLGIPGLCGLSAVLSLLTVVSVQKCPWLLALPAAGLAIGTALGGILPDWVLFFALTLGGLWVSQGGILWRQAVLLPLLAALCLGLVLPFLEPVSRAGEAMQAGTQQLFHKLRYESGKNTFPEGNLQNLGPWTPSEAPALTLNAGTEEKLYLRGFVGAEYGETGWTSLSEESLKDQDGLFYWLHDSGFYGQNQLSLAQDSLKPQPISITLEGACRRYAYLPYGLSSALDARNFPDEAAFAEGREIRADYVPGTLFDWYEAQAILSTGAGDPQYLSLESAYRDFVYSHYVALPEGVLQTVGLFLKVQDEAMTLPQIQKRIRERLDSGLTYDPAVTTRNGDTEFLSYLLTAQNRGYSVHYATAAVCMLRYFGVPARYVEGYFIPKGLAEAPLTVSESMAHAWAELYLDGVGWVPFEVTPGYVDPDDLNLQSQLEDPNSPLNGKGDPSRVPQKYLVPQTHIQPPQEQIVEQHSPVLLPWYTVWVLLALVVLALSLWVGLLRLRLHRKLRSLREAPPKIAIAGLYAYGAFLLTKKSLTQSEALPWEAAEADRLEAMFSNHPMTEAQKDAAIRFLEALRKECRSQWSFGTRVLLWLRGIY